MDALEAAPIRGSHELPVDVTFSPDGQWIRCTPPEAG